MPTEIAATWSRPDWPAACRPAPACRRLRRGRPGAGDRGAAGAAVGLQHVAVEGDLAFAQGLEVGHGAQAAADQALDFLGAAGLLALGGLAALRVCVARGSMPYSAVTQPWPLPRRKGGRLLRPRRAQHAGVAHLDQHRAFGVTGEIAGDLDGAELVRLALAGAHGFSLFLRVVFVDGVADFVDRLFDLLIAQSLL
jgi:hypothetical protein